MPPRTRYAQTGEISLAYQVLGEGPDVMFLPGWISQVEHVWESPPLRRFLERLATFSRVILFDRRGTGLSDGVGDPPSLEDEVDDAIAVLDAAGSERAALLAYALGGPTAVHMAARRPDRVGALVLYSAAARTTWAHDYDWAPTVEERTALIEVMIEGWGEANRMKMFSPSLADDPGSVDWFARLERLASSPGNARKMSMATNALDVREELPAIRVPTLVLHRPDEHLWDVRHSQYLAERIPGARAVWLAGEDSFPWVGDSDAILEEIEEFLTGARTGNERERALLTVMFTDICDATSRAGQVGDRRWRDLLAQHDEAVRRELRRYDGREVKTIGDSFLAVWSGPPSRALRCALAIVADVGLLGIDVRIGMHTGECELIGDDVGGMAVHIASRVNGLADAGEVLVSGTVYGTVVGGPFTFEFRGTPELKGVPGGGWPLFALGA
jgi:pimeloyl-ACP methyl ester carboxylesterase